LPNFRENHLKRMNENNPMANSEIALKSYVNRENNEKSGLEKKFEFVCDGLPIEYIGDGSFTIAHKIPDFKVIDQNKVIEIWASDALWSQYRDATWIANRKALFKKHGYEVLMLPINQNKFTIEKYQEVREQVSRFIHNGTRIVSIDHNINQYAMVRLYGSKYDVPVVYNFEVEDNHTYVANGVVVHNCDTYFDSGNWFTIDELDLKIEIEVDRYFTKDNDPHSIPEWADFTWNHNKRKIVLVITGGEPLLQRNIVPFLQRMNQQFEKSQIESNGIVYQDIPKETTLVVSPKCLEKGGKAIRYLEPNQKILERADCLKFVMSADPQSPYSSIPDWALQWRKDTNLPVFISPMNIYNREPEKAKQLRASKDNITMEERSTIDEVISFWEPGLLDMEQNQKNHEYSARYCIQHGLTFNLQAHLFASLA